MALAAVLGLTLVLQQSAIGPGHRESPAAAAPAVAENAYQPSSEDIAISLPPATEQQVLGERAAGRTSVLGAEAPSVTQGALLPLGQASPAPTAPAQLPPAQPTATPVVIALNEEAIENPAASRLIELSDCEYSHGPLYCVYEVQPGDTLAVIARRAGLKRTEALAAHDLLLLSNQPSLTRSADVLEAGKMLRVPLLNGVIHTVISQETLSEIAHRYGVDADDIIAVTDNRIGESGNLVAGQDILIPNPARSGIAAEPAETALSIAVLSWPSPGALTSTFGPDHPKGIDIALMPGDPVLAAADGVVSFAGGDPCCSYGYFVIIDHGNGLHTVYGHLSRIDVVVGELVSRLEQIGLGGETGYAIGPHLHFEVRSGDLLVNPLAYLP